MERAGAGSRCGTAAARMHCALSRGGDAVGSPPGTARIDGRRRRADGRQTVGGGDSETADGGAGGRAAGQRDGGTAGRRAAGGGRARADGGRQGGGRQHRVGS